MKIKKIETHESDDGIFRELIRDDDHLLDHFGQVSISKVYKGAIKAFHWHKLQDDIFYVLQGNLEIVLYDRRKNSRSYKQTQVFFSGEDHEQAILYIPRGVAHGYRVIGDKDAIILYCMNKSYNKNSPDEERIPFNDPDIGYRWDKK